MKSMTWMKKYIVGGSFALLILLALSLTARAEIIITFDANGGYLFNTPQQQIYTNKLTEKSPRRDGYTFLGWSIYQNATYPELLPGSTLSDPHSMTLYAVWEPAENLGIITSPYSLQRTFGISDSVYYYRFIANCSGSYALYYSCDEPNYWHSTIYLQELNAQGGYNTIGIAGFWSQDIDPKVMTITQNKEYFLCILPKWTKEGELQVSLTFNIPSVISYNPNGGDLFNTPSQQVYYEDGLNILTKETPRRDGYTFLGWNTDGNANMPMLLPGEVYSGPASTTLYAIWQEAYELGCVTSPFGQSLSFPFSKSAYYYRFSVPHTGSYSVRFSCNETNYWYTAVNFQMLQNDAYYFDSSIISFYSLDREPKVVSLSEGQEYYLRITPQWSMGSNLEAKLIIRNTDSANNLPDYVLPNNIRIIETQAFANTSAKYVFIPDSEDNIVIGENAFSGCADLVQIRIPSSVIEIADNAVDRKDIIIVAPTGSYAQEWALKNGLYWINE